MDGKSRYSIQQLRLNFSLMALAMVIMLSAFSFFVVKHNLEEQRRQGQIENLNTKTDHIKQIIEFYRDMVRRIARQNNMVDMLLFYEDVEIQRWAVNMQNIIPQSVGISLFDREGDIRGNPVTLRLGEQCVRDIHKFIRQVDFTDPPIHKNNPMFEHFDIYERLYDDDGFIGAIFVSFSLGILQAELEQITYQGEYLMLFSDENQLVARTNKLTGGDSVSTYNIDVEGTDWKLRATYDNPGLGSLLAFFGAINIFMLILLYLVLYVYSRKLIGLFTDDFKAIQAHLLHVKNHPHERKIINHSPLNETADIVRNIQHLADDISQLTSFSKTDELTGVPNRRAFNENITRYIQLAHRDVNVSVVVVDVDYFKQANDRYGHIVGDTILRILGDILIELTRDTDTCARLGGDEFVAVLINSNRNNVTSWYDRLTEQFARRQVKQIMEIKDSMPVCSLSAGFTRILTTDTKSDSILHRADNALYTAKESGRGRIYAHQND